MAESSPHTRVSRSRRAIALMAWGLLIVSAVFLWDARQTGSLTIGANPIFASLLASFSAFVAVFAWMLFNANHRRSTDSFAAAAATLFPPPIIAFSLISSDSPLRWWMALGIAMLVVIAILSHVPDEFFGVPRGRSSYVVPLPVFDRMENGVLDPNASWFTFNDLSHVVSDTERPSLAPKAYLNRESEFRSSGATSAYGPARPVSSVDDILGTDYDIGLLDDSLMDFELDSRPIPSHDSPIKPLVPERRSTSSVPQKARQSTGRSVDRPLSSRRSAYLFNPHSRHLDAAVGKRSMKIRNANFRHRMDRRDRHAATIRREASADRHSALTQVDSLPSRIVERDRGAVTNTSQTTSPPVTQTPVPSPPASRSTEYRSDADYRRSTESKRDRERKSASQDKTATSSGFGLRPESETRPESASSRGESRPLDSGPAKAYFQETNQNRADRHRARNASSSVRYESTSEAKPEADAVPDSRLGIRSAKDTISEQPITPSETPRRGGSIFGVPLPFGIGGNAAEPEQKALPEIRPDRLVGDSSVTDRAGQQTASNAGQSIQEFRSTVEDRPAKPTAPTRQQRRSRYEQEANQPQERPAPNSKASASPTSPDATHFERTKDDHGSELVEGVMTLRFDKGQKRANLHIPFSPPLPGMPEVECECVGDVPLRLKVPVRQSYGIRIEARRTNADEALDAEVGFAAVYTP